MSEWDVYNAYGNRAVLTCVKHVWDVGKSLPFNASYLAEDEYGQKFLYPGMIVAYNDDETMYVPYNEDGSYGELSSYPVGVNYVLYDCTFRDQIIAPATRAAVIEAHCFVYGGSLGDISDEVKEALRLIQWD